MKNKPVVTQAGTHKTVRFIKYPHSENITMAIFGPRGGELGLIYIDAEELTNALLEARGISTRWAACTSCGETFRDHACPPNNRLHLTGAVSAYNPKVHAIPAPASEPES